VEDFGNDALLQQLREVFFEESEEGLARMESILVEATDGQPLAPEDIASMFRVMHSIKGGAGTIGLNRVVRVAHAAESFLDKARDGELEVGDEDRSRLLRILDELGVLIQAAKTGQEGDEAAGLALAEELGDGAARPARPEDEASSGKQRLRVRLKPKPGLMDSGNDPHRLLRELDEMVGFDVRVDDGALPKLEAMDPTELYLSWELDTKAPIEAGEVEEIFSWIDDLAEIEIGPVPAESKERASASTAGAASATPATASSIRVQLSKVDRLMNLVGELVITQSMLSQLAASEEERSSERWLQGLSQLQRSTRDLQESVMGIRMVPMSFLFSRFPRMVRDLAIQLDKKVKLVIQGETNELDRTLVEQMSDPLVHLVRNAIDHGLETTADRGAAGKNPEGRISLRAFQQGDKMIVEVKDDGKGIDHEKVRVKAIEKGLMETDQELPRESILQLLFEPGFSTADKVSDLSGRGVGLDVVRRNVQAIGGALEIDSQLGVGTTFTLKLPLTLAITDGQLVRLAGETFVVPVLSIVESVQRRRADFTMLPNGRFVTEFRGVQVPVVDGGETLGLRFAKRSDEARTFVIVEDGGRCLALGVDELLGQQQVVVKSLEENFQRVHGVSGATILGDGKVALILEVSELGGPRAVSNEVAA
jgi:two-component system, chemotaxis family, sensor kinase CheA